MSIAAHTGARLPSRLSPSALSRFRSCPKQFLLTDIERVARNDDRSPVLAQANALHDALQRFYGLRLEYRSADNLERCLRACWVKHRAGAFSSVDQEAASGIAAIGVLRDYAAKFDITIEPVSREKWVGLTLDGTSLYGKIDRVDRLDNSLSLIDYKTGRRMLDLADLRSEPAIQVYVLGAEASLRRPVARVRIIYVSLGEEVSWDLEREDVEQLRGALSRTLRDIHDEQAFEARPGPQCGFCPAQLDCPEKDRVEIEAVVVAADAEELPF